MAAAGPPPADEALDAFLASNKYPAKQHLARVVDYMRQNASTDLDQAVLLLEASKSVMWPNSDQEAPLRQDRYFFYGTGCELADSSLVYDVSKQKSTLFIPPIVDDHVIWSGLPLQPNEALKKYDVDEVKTTDELDAFLASGSLPKKIIYTVDTPSTALNAFQNSNKELLKEAIAESRVIKDAYEIALIRKANTVSEKAHTAVFRAARTAKNERELFALFVQQCTANGAPSQAYSPIMAAGTNAATLHYVQNAAPINESTLNLLLDAGAETSLYASDITRTFPINGKFTRESLDIYSLVLDIQKTCIQRLRAGILWDELQQLTHEMVVDGLLKLGVLRGDRTAILQAQTSAAFFPHGLGHYLGMDTHDTGGHPNYSDPSAYFRYLRVRGTLPAGSVITVEPGVYFCRFIIEPYLTDDRHKQFIDEKTLDRYWAVGGVRIEDNVLVLEGGSCNLTTVPKEAGALEALVHGG